MVIERTLIDRYRYNSTARASVAEARRSAASRINYLPRRITKGFRTLFKHPRRLAHDTVLAFSHYREHHFIVARAVLRRKRLGVLGLELWTEGRRTTRVLKWRAGIWRRIFVGKKALEKWQRHAQHQQDIELAAWVTERRKRRWKGATSPYAIQQAVVRALCRNAWACSLRRSVFNAWAAHRCLMVRAKKQVRESHLRSGFDGFRSWALSSLRKREHHLHAFRHAVHRIKHATYMAWKNYVFPTGLSLRRNLPLRVVRSHGIMSPTRETSSHVTLLHLPIIRIRMQRVLNGWRRVAVQGKRQRYVDDSLSLKTTRVHSELFHKDYFGTDNSLHVVIKRLPQRRVGVRVRSIESTSMSPFEESIVGSDGGMILAKHDSTPAGSRAQDFDRPRQPRAKLYGGSKGGSYLEQYLIKTSGK